MKSGKRFMHNQRVKNRFFLASFFKKNRKNYKGLYCIKNLLGSVRTYLFQKHP